MARALIVLLLAVFSLAASDLTKLEIVVTNEAGKPVEQAEVIVKFVQGRSVRKFGAQVRKSWEVRSSQDGIAKIPAIPQGKILVQVNAKSYQTFGQIFDVQEEERT